jgi:hypothetical protein
MTGESDPSGENNCGRSLAAKRGTAQNATAVARALQLELDGRSALALHSSTWSTTPFTSFAERLRLKESHEPDDVAAHNLLASSPKWAKA